MITTSALKLKEILAQPDYKLLDSEDMTQPQGSNSSSDGDKAEATNILLEQLRLVGLPEPVQEYRFHPSRKWRGDLAWIEQRLIVEIEGGIWLQTDTGRSKGHAHPTRFIGDIEKYNQMIILGWRLLRFTPAMVKDGTAVTGIMQILEGK